MQRAIDHLLRQPGGRHLEFKRAEADPRFVAQYQATQDPSNRQRLKRDMLEDAVQGSRDESLDFYRLWATDEAFRKTFTQLFDRALEGGQQLSADL